MSGRPPVVTAPCLGAHHASRDDEHGAASGVIEEALCGLRRRPQWQLDHLDARIVQRQQTGFGVFTGNAYFDGFSCRPKLLQ